MSSGLCVGVIAQEVDGDEIGKKLQGWQSQIESTQKAIERIGTNGNDLSGHRQDLTEIITATAAFAEELRPRLKNVTDQLGKLGEPPGQEAAPEAPAVASERERLTNTRETLDGAIKTAKLLGERAQQLIGRIEELRRARFAQEILRRTQSPLLPGLWQQVIQDWHGGYGSLTTLVSGWWKRAQPHSQLLVLVLVAAAFYAGLAWLAHHNIRRHRAYSAEEVPAYFERVASAANVTFWRALPGVATALLLYGGLAHLDLLAHTIAPLARSILTSFLIYRIISALIRTLLAPNHFEWHLLPVPEAHAARISMLAQAMAGVYAVDRVVHTLNSVLFSPLALTVAQSFFFSMIFVLLFGAILLTPWRPAGTEAERASKLWPMWLKLPLWAILIAIVLADVAGYIALGRFMSAQVVVTGTILVAAVLVHLAVRALTADLIDDERPAALWFARHVTDSPTPRRIVAITLATLLHGVLALAVIPLILLQWGVSWDQIRGSLTAAFFGFEVGGFRVSIAQILIAIALLAAGLTLTRLFQRWLDSTVLDTPRLDVGLANSVRTGVGYVGTALAVLLAVSYAGLDFTNLAIVAGALSVGIGFGLQSIVNNFVSGLILLVERPIKVGDWIEAGVDQGYVKRISVRSTEIETFDRSSVIVPNSELISGRVTNWTLHNALGRLVIRVGVAYGSDPDHVHDVLMEVGRAHDKVLAWPQPSVHFEAFADSSLNYSLRVYIPDVNEVLQIQTELNTAILKAFRQEGIEIPYPQSDVHLRDLDAVKSAFSRVASERARQEAETDEEAGQPDQRRPPKNARSEGEYPSEEAD